VRNLPTRRPIPLVDANGRYFDTHLEKIYSVLKPHLKGMRVDRSKSTAKTNNDIRGLCGNDLSRLMLDHNSHQLMRLARQLAIRGLFRVDYEKFPTYRVAAQEACRMFPQHYKSALILVAAASDNVSSKTVETFLPPTMASQPDQDTRPAHPESENATEVSKELPSPYPWETVRLPNMNEFEPTTNRDMVPDLWRMRFFPALETSTQLNNDETSDALGAGRIRNPCSPEPVSALKQSRGLKFIDSQLSQFDPPEIPDRVHEQKQIPEFAPSKRLELPADSRFGKPSRILRVYGHYRGAAKKYIPQAFANFSPTKFIYSPRRKLVFVHFTGIEAATEALWAKDGALIGGRFLSCTFREERLQEAQGHVQTVAPERTVNDDVEDMLSLPGHMWDELPSAGSIPVAGEVVTQTSTDVIIGTASKPRKPSVTDDLSPVSESSSPDLVKVARVRKELSKSTIKTPNGEAENKQSQDIVPTSVTSNGLETDDHMIPAQSSALDALELNPRWKAMTSRSTSGVKKDTDADPVHSEISQHATIAVPETRAFYLPHPVQHKILCSLQASVERLCFEYIKRKDPKMLEETESQWAIDSPHALELNQYMYLFNRSDEFGPKTAKLVRGRTMRNLYMSMIALRHDAVHRKRADIKSLRNYARDASSLAAIAGDSKAAAQYKTLGNSLHLEHYRIEVTRKKAEEQLLATVKEVAAKRTELDREAMDRFREVHKQFSARTYADLDRIVDANISLEYGPGVDSGDASSIEPVNHIWEEASTIEPVSEDLEEASTTQPMSDVLEETSSIEPVSEDLEDTLPFQSVNDNLEEASTVEPVNHTWEEVSTVEPLNDDLEEASTIEPMSGNSGETSTDQSASDIPEETSSIDSVGDKLKEASSTEPLRLPTEPFRSSTEPVEPVGDNVEEPSTVEPVNENIEEASTTQPASVISEEVSSTDLVRGGLKKSTWTEPLRLPTGLFRLSTEPNSSSEETLSTDPVSGIFGKLKIWYGA
jgi:hypothetical protein